MVPVTVSVELAASQKSGLCSVTKYRKAIFSTSLKLGYIVALHV